MGKGIKDKIKDIEGKGNKGNKNVTHISQMSLKHFLDEDNIGVFVTLSKGGDGFDLILLDSKNKATNCRSFVEVIHKLIDMGLSRDDALKKVDRMANMIEEIAYKIRITPIGGIEDDE